MMESVDFHLTKTIGIGPVNEYPFGHLYLDKFSLLVLSFFFFFLINKFFLRHSVFEIVSSVFQCVSLSLYARFISSSFGGKLIAHKSKSGSKSLLKTVWLIKKTLFEINCLTFSVRLYPFQTINANGFRCYKFLSLLGADAQNNCLFFFTLLKKIVHCTLSIFTYLY